MPKCKYCHKNISKFDKDRCPYCGGVNPLEGVNSVTCDITQVIDTCDDSNTDSNFVQHSKKINSLLLMFLGIFGVDSFYLGFIKEGLLRLFINFILYAGLFCLFFFVNKFSLFNLIMSLILPFVILFAVYFIIGIVSLFKKNKKDSNGVFLK
ncbi:MAG TPA: hypothetical protein DEA28_02825 [Firmicutes bacterium]|nr:hypothetical protein [Bacillota bacterium]